MPRKIIALMKKRKLTFFLYQRIKSLIKYPRELKLFIKTKKKIKKRSNAPRIYYLGAPVHANLGDQAQGICIRKWLKNFFSGREIVEIETNELVNTHFSVLKELKKKFKEDDFFVFQSGYTTTDLGGHADEMHCIIMQTFPNAKMLMMPQTIYFQSEKRKKHTSQIYNGTSNLFFLARDNVSYEMAVQMFPDIEVRCYPDIVTTLIGKRTYTSMRSGIMFCCRDDSEKYYKDEEISLLMKRCKEFANVYKTDTTKKANKAEIIKNPEKFIDSEIESYSHYKVVITDRYHGTIFSLVAGTPVIIVKTTDHKVTTGADWFKGVYDDYVYVADSLEEAYVIARKLYNSDLSHKLEPYFETKYYDVLLQTFCGDKKQKQMNRYGGII